jgi:protein-S-isoprenylcysteine O-methyltransferase Ste14/uncharacterized membrane protein (UPF0127 family)
MHQARVASSGVLFVERLRRAETHWARLKGLLGSGELLPGEGLWLDPCRQVHMFGMRYPVDVAFLDADGRVVRAIAGLAPGRISPRVDSARSVLELPAGTLERFGLGEHSRVEIVKDGIGPVTASGRQWEAIACNLALAVLYTVFTEVHLAFGLRTGRWLTVAPVVVQESLLVLLFATRRRSVSTSSRVYDWVIGIVGSFLPFLFRPRDQPSAFDAIGVTLQVVGVMLAVIAIASLGRSFGLVAANRGVKTGGLYGAVRHPIYTGYIVSYLGYLASHPTLRNGVIALAAVLALLARATVEEELLADDRAYHDYRQRTPWRFVPYLY